MFPTEAYIIALLVAVVGGLVIRSKWAEWDEYDRLAFQAITFLLVMLAFLLVSEAYWVWQLYSATKN